MAGAERVVTVEEIDAIGAKLSPAFDALSDDEREIFTLVMAQGGDDAEVSGFGQGMSLGMETMGGLSASGAQAAGGSGAQAGWRLSWFRDCSGKVDCCWRPGGGVGNA